MNPCWLLLLIAFLSEGLRNLLKVLLLNEVLEFESRLVYLSSLALFTASPSVYMEMEKGLPISAFTLCYFNEIARVQVLAHRHAQWQDKG